MIIQFVRLLIIFSLPMLAISLQAMHHEKPLDGTKIIEKYVEAQEVDSELDYIKMSIISPGPTILERRFLAVYKTNPNGERFYLIRIIRPADVQGVTLLAKQDSGKEIEQHLYLPDVGEARKLRGKSQSGAFLGSDFTFQDLLRETPSNFRYERQDDAFVNGVECFKVKASPASTEEGGIYLYRNLYIDKVDFEMLQIDYYGPGKELVKTFNAFDYHSSKIKGKTTRPRRAVMEDKKNNSVTVFTVIEGRVNEKISNELFTPEKIENWTADEVDEFIYDYGFVVRPQS